MVDKEVARVVRPENKLKKKIGTDVNLREILHPEVVENAQRIIMDKKGEFLGWAAEDLAAMEDAYYRLTHDGAKTEALEIFSKHASSLRDRSGTFGYHLGSDIAKSLARYCSLTQPVNKHLALVIRPHLDGLQTVFRDHVTESGGVIGMELLQSIKKLVEKYPPA